jgi:Ca-activated chloride channel family protein
VRIYPVGVGTTNGTVLELEGFTVHTRLEAAALQEIAQLSDGAYFSAEERADLERIYDEVGAQLVISAEETELTALFAGAGMLLLLAGGLCSLFWFSRLP